MTNMQIHFRLRFDSHRGSFASNLEQVANLLCAQVNSASYPQRDRKWVVAYELRGEGLVWLIGAVVCLLAANRGSTGNGWPHSALPYHQLMPVSCHFRDCKSLLVVSLTHVRSAIASTRPWPLFGHRGWLLWERLAVYCLLSIVVCLVWTDGAASRSESRLRSVCRRPSASRLPRRPPVLR